MRTAVIGGSGFIGRRLCEACLRRGDEVSALVRSPDAAASLISTGVRVVTADLSDEDAVRRTCADADRVFNSAGALGKWRTHASDMEFVNAVAPGMIVRCAAESGVGRVVHVSTAGVSGPLPPGIAVDEGFPPRPVTAYQRTKLAGEESALREHAATGVPLTIVRPAFVYGPADTHKLSLFRSVANRRFLYVDQGRSRLHPIYIADLIDGLLLASQHGSGDGDTYIMGGPAPMSIRGVVEAIADSVSAEPPTLSLPRSVVYMTAAAAETIGRMVGKEPPVTRSKVDLMSTNYVYITERARERLNFHPIVQPVEGIRMTAEWYLRKGLL